MENKIETFAESLAIKFLIEGDIEKAIEYCRDAELNKNLLINYIRANHLDFGLHREVVETLSPLMVLKILIGVKKRKDWYTKHKIMFSKQKLFSFSVMGVCIVMNVETNQVGILDLCPSDKKNCKMKIMELGEEC
jgi:hypothetical protein